MYQHHAKGMHLAVNFSTDSLLMARVEECYACVDTSFCTEQVEYTTLLTVGNVNACCRIFN